MHFRILPDHQKLFVKKDLFDCLEWLKTCFDAFSHTSIPPETFFQKRYFLPPGVVKSVFWCISTYFPTNRNSLLKEIFFTVWSGYKRVLMHFRILPYHQKPFFRKNIFLLSGVVKNVFFCICAYFPITRNFFSEKIFFTVWSG
jgi:hypothetical protein